MGISTLMQFWGREISYGYISDKALEIKDIHKPSGHIFRFWTFFSIILFYEVLPIFAQIETIILQLSVNMGYGYPQRKIYYLHINIGIVIIGPAQCQRNPLRVLEDSRCNADEAEK